MDRKIALVTGGVGGIGSAICDRLLGMNYHVVANYHPEFDAEAAREWEKKHWSYPVTTYPGDVTERGEMREMSEWIEHHHGPVSVLVNCAGVTNDSLITKMDDEQWDSVIAINLTGAFNITKQVVPHMKAQSWGRIINISSVNGQRGQIGQCNYSASKAGLHGFSKALARELVRDGITVNTVAPGYINTKMTEAIPDKVKEKILRFVPMNRMGQPEEIAATVGFLASEIAGYITGAEIPVNGGMHMV